MRLATALTGVLALLAGAACSGGTTAKASGAADPVGSSASSSLSASPSVASASAEPSGSSPTSPPSPAPAVSTEGPTAAATAATTSSPGSVPAATPTVAGLPNDGQTVSGTTAAVHHLSLDGITRTWVSYAPPGGSAGLPLVVFLHGTDSTVSFESARDRLLPFVAAGLVSVVYPVGYQENWNAGQGCCGEAAAKDLHDLAFVRQVTDRAISRLAADRGRVYLAGYSAGGKLGWQLVCDDPGAFAALATYGANPTTPCPHTGVRVPVLIGFGSLDRAEPLLGEKTDSRGPHPPVTVNLDAWLARNGCPAASTTATRVGVTVQSWACADDTTVVYDLWPKALHVWPGPPKLTVDGSPGPVFWDFLSRQQGPAGGLLTASPGAAATPASP